MGVFIKAGGGIIKAKNECVKCGGSEYTQDNEYTICTKCNEPYFKSIEDALKHHPNSRVVDEDKTLTAEQLEMISLVQRVDSWSQENNGYVDRQFSNLYCGDEGWEGVFKENQPAFYKAYGLALEYREKAESAGFY